MLDRQQFGRFRVSPTDPATLRIADVDAHLKKLVEASGNRIRVEQLSESFEGRPILVVTLGSGPRRVLLWSQMHGDEPTHTAVLLDLLSYLARMPTEPRVADIVAGCTLMMLPMLNPDGAERWTRFNAQGIDVNRDALRLATPEGRALRNTVDAFRPQFAFNLHNQNARTSVGSPPRPAAASVLAPPIDASGTQTPELRRAKQMAACFVETVRPFAEGMISRYDDEFEPRAFGDTIQASGASTMLIEAGGWPEDDAEPLVRLHFHGLLTTLHAIATDRLNEFDVQVYESLPESNSRNLFDCVVTGGQLLDAQRNKSYRADLGIDGSRDGHTENVARRAARIVDIGDLTTMGGQRAIDARGCLIVPGRIAFLRDWRPVDQLPDDRLEALLANGITTVVGAVDLLDRDALEEIRDDRSLPVNWAYAALLESTRSVSSAALLENAALAAARGAIAVVGGEADESLWQNLDYFGLSLLKAEQLPTVELDERDRTATIRRVVRDYEMFMLAGSRGTIARGRIADFVMFEMGERSSDVPLADPGHLKRVLVAGDTVWENGRRTSATPGALLTRG
jgi:hypothetical protein